MKITVVIPVFNEKDTLESLADGVLAHAGEHEIRLLFVDDGSTDGSFDVLSNLAGRHDAVGVIRFRRNRGKSAALAAGFARAQGDLVVTMDADLQDDPKEIPRLLAKLDEGYDVVSGWKSVRLDPWHKTLPSRVYNRLVARLFRLELHDVNCGFKVYRREVVERLDIYGDRHRLIPVLAAHLGYRIAEVPVEHHPRRFGVSKYGIERFSRGAMDVLALLFLDRHARAPGHFFGKWGFAAVLAGGPLTLAGGLFGGAMGLALLALAVGTIVAGLLSVELGLLAELLVQQRPSDETAPFVAETLGWPNSPDPSPARQRSRRLKRNNPK